MKVETSKNKTGNETKNPQSALADINRQIEVLTQQRLALVEPQKARYIELRAELVEIENQIRALDNSWRPEPLKARAEVKITELLVKGQPMTVDEICKELKGVYTKWKLKKTLSDKSQGEKAVFVFADGKYSLKPTAAA